MQYGTTQVVKKGHLNRFFTNFLRDKLWGKARWLNANSKATAAYIMEFSLGDSAESLYRCVCNVCVICGIAGLRGALRKGEHGH